ncbi:hypothetical protein HanIR_Chr13g0616301 [Helianthus annuus]|nr:hypothetical protein HanIR_Chr13g0616301 [Helianthus annuus]
MPPRTTLKNSHAPPPPPTSILTINDPKNSHAPPPTLLQTSPPNQVTVPSPPQITLPKPTTSFELYERRTGTDATPSTAPTKEPKQAPDFSKIRLGLFTERPPQPAEYFGAKQIGNSHEVLHFKRVKNRREWRPPWQPPWRYVEATPKVVGRVEWRPPWCSHTVLEDKDIFKGAAVDTVRPDTFPSCRQLCEATHV